MDGSGLFPQMMCDVSSEFECNIPLAKTVSEGDFVNAPGGKATGYPATVCCVHDLHILGLLQHWMGHSNACQRASHFELIIIFPANISN